MSLPDAVTSILLAFHEATDRVQVWAGAPRLDLVWGEVEAEFYAMLREDDPEVGSNPRFRVLLHIDLPAAYAIQRAGDAEDFLPDDATLVFFEMDLRLPPARRLRTEDELERIARAVSDYPAIPSCQIDYGNDELPYGHVLSFERYFSKGEYLADFGAEEEDGVERRHLVFLFDFLAEALREAKRYA